MKDALGNVLKVGDLVALQLERPLIWGVIEEVEDGGHIVGIGPKGSTGIRPGLIRIKSMHSIAVNPDMPQIGAVLALRDEQSVDLNSLPN